jgi:hypothetical protein
MDAAAPLFGELVTECRDAERARKAHAAHQVLAASREGCLLIATGRRRPASHESSVQIQPGGVGLLSSASRGGHRMASGAGLSRCCRWGGRPGGRCRLRPGESAGP